MYTVNNAKEQITTIRQIFEKDLCTFYGGQEQFEKMRQQTHYSPEHYYTQTGIPRENDNVQDKLKSIKKKMKDIEREAKNEVRELKRDVRDLERDNRFLSRRSWYNPLVFWDLSPVRTNTIVVVKDEEKKEKKEDNDEVSTAGKVLFATAASAIAAGTMYTVVKDERIQLYLTGIDDEVEKLREMTTKMMVESDSVSQITFKSRCENFLNLYSNWRNQFAERVNALLYTKIGAGTILLTGLTGFVFSIPFALTTAAVSSPLLALYGTWHYFTSDKKKESEKNKFDNLLSNLKELDNCQVLGSYPVLPQNQSMYSDFVYSPSAPVLDQTPTKFQFMTSEPQYEYLRNSYEPELMKSQAMDSTYRVNKSVEVVD